MSEEKKEEPKPVVMLSAEEEKKEEPKSVIDEQTQKMWDNLNQQANDENRGFFEYLMTNDEYQFNGTDYKYKMIKRKDMGELIRLRTEGAGLDKNDDFQSYSENIMKRACIVIEGMTPEQFDEGDYDLLENIVVAWSLKDRGFRKYKPRT